MVVGPHRLEQDDVREEEDQLQMKMIQYLGVAMTNTNYTLKKSEEKESETRGR